MTLDIDDCDQNTCLRRERPAMTARHHDFLRSSGTGRLRLDVDLNLGRIPAGDRIELCGQAEMATMMSIQAFMITWSPGFDGLGPVEHAAISANRHVGKNVEGLGNAKSLRLEIGCHDLAQVSGAAGMIVLHTVQPIAMLIAGRGQQVVDPAGISDQLKDRTAMVGGKLSPSIGHSLLTHTRVCIAERCSSRSLALKAQKSAH